MPVTVNPNDDAFTEAIDHFENYSQPELGEFLNEQGLLIGGLIQNQRDRIKDNLLSGIITLRDAWDYIDRQEETGHQQIFLFHFAADAAQLLDPLEDLHQLWSRVMEYAKAQASLVNQADPHVDHDSHSLVQYLKSRENCQSLLENLKSREDCQGLLQYIQSLVSEDNPEAVADYLGSLNGEQNSKSGEIRLVDRYLLWPSKVELAGVYARSRPNREIILKFVETRYWEDRVVVDGGFRYDPRLKRSANYFRLNLNNRTAEIRLQNLPLRSRLSLRQELELYREEVRKFLNGFPFIAVLLESAIRRLLISSRAQVSPPKLTVTDWRVDFAGRPLGGGVNPSLLNKFFLTFARYTPLMLTGDWTLGKGTVRASLDGKRHIVGIPKRARGILVAAVLEKILREKPGEFHIDELRLLAKKNKSWQPTLHKYDLLFYDANKKAVTVERMARDTFTPSQEALDVANALREKHPEIFELNFYVRCPETGRRIRQRGADVVFSSSGDVPAEIKCDHAKPKRALLHKTKGMIEAELTYKSAAEKDGRGVLPVVSRYLQRILPPEKALAAFVPIALLIFFILFIVAIAASSWVFSLLAERFPNNNWIAFSGFALVLFFGTGIVVKALGEPATSMAITVFRAVLEFPRTLLGLSPNPRSPAGDSDDPTAPKSLPDSVPTQSPNSSQNQIHESVSKR
jgi:hypothetical protein